MASPANLVDASHSGRPSCATEGDRYKQSGPILNCQGDLLVFRKLLIVGFALFTAACVPITPEASVPEVDIATPQPPSPRADLNDLASVLAKVDESDDSDKHAAILQKFADCFLSGMTAREREEGLSDNPGNAITPAQITALTLFQAGVFAAIGQYEQLHAVEQADSFPNMTSMYELLEGALAMCEDSK